MKIELRPLVEKKLAFLYSKMNQNPKVISDTTWRKLAFAANLFEEVLQEQEWLNSH